VSRFATRAFALALLAASFAGPARAEDRPAVVVTDPSAKAYRAAVQRFADRQLTGDAEVVARLRSSVNQALDASMIVTSVDPKAFLGPDETMALDGVPPPSCGDWKQIGADALVEGLVRTGAQGLEVEFRIWDTVRCKSLQRKRYFGGAGDVPMIARRIADDVIEAFTGRAGVSATEIAFISDRTGRKEVFVMNADGSDVRAATSNRSINSFPGWAPGGNEIVYTSYRHLGQPTLFLLTRGKRTPGRLLTRIDNGAPIYRGVFSPDGERLAFVMSVDGAPEIFVARRDGRGPKQLTRSSAIDISPSWSPDGKQLAFVSDRSGAPQLYVMDADGGNVRRLTFQGSYNTGPAWSPDGKWIAYESRVGAQFDIWLIDPEGQVNAPFVMHPRSDESPSWSPDGRWLAFSSTRRGNADIHVVAADGKELRRLTMGEGNNTSPSWGPYPSSR
jgi:TolB protein